MRSTRRFVSSKRSFASWKTRCAVFSRLARLSSRTSLSRKRRYRSTPPSAWVCARRCQWIPRSVQYSSSRQSCVSRQPASSLGICSISATFISVVIQFSNSFYCRLFTFYDFFLSLKKFFHVCNFCFVIQFLTDLKLQFLPLFTFLDFSDLSDSKQFYHRLFTFSDFSFRS